MDCLVLHEDELDDFAFNLADLNASQLEYVEATALGEDCLAHVIETAIVEDDLGHVKLADST